MKAVILAAGKGSRLGDLTKNTPKSMLKLNEDHTLMSYNLTQIKQIGIQSVIIITGYEAAKLENHAQNICDNLNLKVTFIYNPFWNTCNVLGSFYMGLDKINDDFLFLHADTITEKPVLNGVINAKENICLAVDFKACGDEEMKFWLKDGQIVRITKKHLCTEADGEFVGIAKFSRKMINYFRNTSITLFRTGNLGFYMEAVLDYGLKNKDITVDYFDSTNYKSIEVDFKNDLLEARSLFK